MSLTTPIDKLILKTLKDVNSDIKLYLVGGVVRDYFINAQSKDRDYVIVGMKLDEIAKAISTIGSVKEVGKSFGIVTANIDGESYDFAVPRKEISTGELHTDFMVETHNVTLLEDLSRRDFTMNAIAYDVESDMIIDPNNGVGSIKSRTISFCGNPIDRYEEDPLRLLRLIQFMHRFDFKCDIPLEFYTDFYLNKLLTISPERIFEEYKKAFEKGRLLFSSSLFRSEIAQMVFITLFGEFPIFDCSEHIIVSDFPQEFIVNLGLIGMFGNNGNMFNMRMTNRNLEYVETFRNIRRNPITKDNLVLFKNKPILIDLFKMSKLCLWKEQKLIGKLLETPITLKELDIDGNIIMDLGIDSKHIGELVKTIVWDIYNGKLENTNESLVAFINTYKGKLYE